jgi:hypothetical protein
MYTELGLLNNETIAAAAEYSYKGYSLEKIKTLINEKKIQQIKNVFIK